MQAKIQTMNLQETAHSVVTQPWLKLTLINFQEVQKKKKKSQTIIPTFSRDSNPAEWNFTLLRKIIRTVLIPKAELNGSF